MKHYLLCKRQKWYVQMVHRYCLCNLQNTLHGSFSFICLNMNFKNMVQMACVSDHFLRKNFKMLEIMGNVQKKLKSQFVWDWVRIGQYCNAIYNKRTFKAYLNYRSRNNTREGNAFTGVCLSTWGRGIGP